MKNYINYHKHSMYSNIYVIDSPTFPEDYCKRAVELGEDTVFTTEHGWGGDIFEYRRVCDKYGLKCLYGVEGYISPHALPEDKDKSNYHIFIAPKTDAGRKKLNLLSSNANTKYFYYRPRFSLSELLTLDADGFILTTACVGGIVRDDIGISKIFEPLLEHFKYNMFLEIQPHVHPEQVKHNTRVLELRKIYGIKLITGTDSHYIYPQDANLRKKLIIGKGIQQEEKDVDDTFILDYPSIDEIYERYQAQGVVPSSLVRESIFNTSIFDECEPIGIDKTPKMPNIYKDKTPDERYQMLHDLAFSRFEDIIKEDSIQESDIPKYREKLEDCLEVVKETEELNTQDYFLINEKIVKLAVEKYGGVITRTGRGSGGAFYLNRVLGLTQLDSETTTIPIYPERFMSTARILENHSFPDIDINVADQEPFRKASIEVLGDDCVYPMVSYGTMQLNEAFRNYCRFLGKEYGEYNEVAKNIESHENDTEWKDIIAECKKFIDVVISASIHPCSHILLDKNIKEEIGVIRTSKGIVCPITSEEADDWKYLKNDLLSAQVWLIIAKVFEEIGKPIMTLRELSSAVDDKTWQVYEKGMTCTVNQVDSDWGTSLAMRYKPKSIDEVAKLTAAIRPSFDPWRETFISRKPYSNHNKYMDELLAPTDHYILFQENIMQFFEWLGVTPAQSIGIIKKISKKKIKEEDFAALEEGLRKEWIHKCGSIDGFDENWNMIQSCMSYGFNCLSGDTKIRIKINGHWEDRTIESLYVDEIRRVSIYCSSRPISDEDKKLLENYYQYRMVWSYDEQKHLVKNIFDSVAFAGEQEVYSIYTESGIHISCTINHKFPTFSGEKQLSELSEGDYLLYCDCDSRRKSVKKEKIRKILKDGVKKVYYVSVLSPYHTFTLSNGIISSNSPHALAYGYDSTYGAYLKSHYPIQYFTVALNVYEDDLIRTNKLIKEMSFYKIYLRGIQFGKSKDVYTYDLESREIYKSVKSVKYLNREISESLYEISKTFKGDFVDLLYAISDNTDCNSRAITVLIRLDYFKNFGNSKNLETIFDYFVNYKKGKMKQKLIGDIKDKDLFEIFTKNSKQTAKMFVNIDTKQVLKDIFEIIKEKQVDYTITEKMRFQSEYMGYISFNSNNPNDRFKLAIMDVKALIRKSDGLIWAREIDAVSIGNSKRSKLVVLEDYFKNHQLMTGDVIKIIPEALKKKEKNGFTTWYLYSYTIITDEKVRV